MVTGFKTILILFITLFAALVADAQTVIRGTVEDENGAAIAGASVSFVTDNEHTRANTTTDSSGRFELRSTSAENGTIVVNANGFLPNEKRIAADVSDLSIVLSPTPVSAEISVMRSETRIEDTPASVI